MGLRFRVAFVNGTLMLPDVGVDGPTIAKYCGTEGVSSGISGVAVPLRVAQGITWFPGHIISWHVTG